MSCIKTSLKEIITYIAVANITVPIWKITQSYAFYERISKNFVLFYYEV